MLERPTGWRRVLHPSTDEADDADAPFPALRVFTAHLLLAAGLDANLGDADGYSPPPAARWTAAVTLPAAAAAHLAHATHPTEGTARATRLLNAAVLGLGVAGLAGTARAGSPTRLLSSLLVGSAGLLGLLLERQEHLAQEERARLARRASLVERFVPRRRARLDRVVVHV